MHNVLLITTIDAVGVTRLPRILHDAGCRVTLLAPSRNAINSSRFVAERIDGRVNPADMALALREHLAVRPMPYEAVIAADEPLLWQLAEQGAAPWLQEWFPVDLNGSAARTAFSKIAFTQAVASEGVSVPAFRIVHSAGEALQAAEELGFPAVIKIERGLSGSGVRIAADPASFREQFQVLDDRGPVMIQQFITGQVGTTPVLFDHGKPRCWFSAYLRENWPNPFSSSSALELMVHRDVLPLLQGVGAVTGFNGLCGIDWVQDETTGNLLLLELNPRPTPGMYLGPRAGVDFSRAISAWLDGRPVLQTPIFTEAGSYVRMFPQNLYRAMDDRRSLRIPEVLQDAPWDDPRLTAAHIRRVGTHYLPDGIRRFGRSLRRTKLFHV